MKNAGRDQLIILAVDVCREENKSYRTAVKEVAKVVGMSPSGVRAVYKKRESEPALYRLLSGREAVH